VFLCHLEVVSRRYLWAVTQPGRHGLDGELFDQFRFSTAAAILEHLAPRFQPGALDYPMRLSPKVLTCVPVARNDVGLARLGLIEAVQQVSGQFREQRHNAAVFALVRCLGAVDGEPLPRPVDV